ncbi:MAG: DUF1624 domain-containing protein [Gammaproteobacteria bacterium]|nr:DUF1624 domain-containing protein [Gammaproteobacteria bacterium]
MNASRWAAVDMARGVALLMMIGYHFCYDLKAFGRIQADFDNDPLWLGLRTVIVSLFLGLVGVSLQLASRQRLHWGRYFRRLAALAACAAGISVVSFVMYRQQMIFFGILHFILVASLLALPFRSLGWMNAGLGVGLVMLGSLYSHPLFDQPALQWAGLMTHKPYTVDYVPVLPWFGVVLLGLSLGRWLLDDGRLAHWRPGSWGRVLAAGGRHSLLIYMLHQPILLGSLYLIFEVL